MKKTNTLTAIISLVLIVGAVIGIIGLLGSIGFASPGSGGSGSGGSDNTAVSPDTCKHNYTVVSNTVTCTEDGVLTKKCSDCLNVVTSEVTAPGHSIVNYLAKDPTCTEEGFPAYSACSKCEYTTFSSIPALGHDLVAHEDKAATCSEEGYTGKKTCSRCDYFERTVLQKLDHNYEGNFCISCGIERYAAPTTSLSGNVLTVSDIDTSAETVNLYVNNVGTLGYPIEGRESFTIDLSYVIQNAPNDYTISVTVSRSNVESLKSETVSIKVIDPPSISLSETWLSFEYEEYKGESINLYANGVFIKNISTPSGYSSLISKYDLCQLLDPLVPYTITATFLYNGFETQHSNSVAIFISDEIAAEESSSEGDIEISYNGEVLTNMGLLEERVISTKHRYLEGNMTVTNNTSYEIYVLDDMLTRNLDIGVDFNIIAPGETKVISYEGIVLNSDIHFISGGDTKGTWLFDEVIYADNRPDCPCGWGRASFNFTSNGKSYIGIKLHYEYSAMDYVLDVNSADYAYNGSSSGWENEALRTIQITTDSDTSVDEHGFNYVCLLVLNATKLSN